MTQFNATSSELHNSGQVVANRTVCREHYRMTVRVPSFLPASAGQFIHVCPDLGPKDAADSKKNDASGTHDAWRREYLAPMLRRAFSIAALSRTADHTEIDVIYRVVGKATGWMASLRRQDRISVLGPLGNPFPISSDKPVAWLVAGGVGLPPMLWLAESLQRSGKSVVAFCGAQTADLLSVNTRMDESASTDATKATFCTLEFADFCARSIISTDDGSLGFRGHIGTALQRYHDCNTPAADELVVYTCGPEPMMRFVAEFCLARNIECHVCMERAMACGTGLCQSCVVPVADRSQPDGWRYMLCCQDGPVFAAESIVWETASEA